MKAISDDRQGVGESKTRGRCAPHDIRHTVLDQGGPQFRDEASRKSSGSSGSGRSQPGPRKPARVTLTSLPTAASDDRLLAAVRACRQ